MKKTKRIVSLVLALSMVFGYSGNIVPTFATDSVKNNIVQKATAADNNYRIIAVGDSITYGYNGAGSGQVATPYPAKLEQLLDAMTKGGNGTGTDNKTNVADFIVTNNGISGKTMLSSGNLPYINDAAYTSTCDNAKDADAIIIMLGTNDAKAQNWTTKNGKTAEENYTADTLAMVNRFKMSNPNVRIILATAPKSLVAGTGANDINKDTINNKIAPLQRELAIMNGWELVDANFYTKNWTTSQFPDNIHPNQGAYDLMAAFMKEAINDGGTVSSANKVRAVNDFITALPTSASITSVEAAKGAMAAYNRAQKTFDMLTADEKLDIDEPQKTKLNGVKTTLNTRIGAASKVTVTPDATSATLATTSATFADTGDKVTITAQKERIDGDKKYVFHKWAVTAGGVKLDDYITETTTFTKGATAVTVVPKYKLIDMVKPITGSFIVSDRLALPTGNQIKEFEAEDMVLKNVAPTGETGQNGLKIIADRSSSGDLAVTNFNAGDKMELNLSEAQVGHYTVGITYRSLVNPFPGEGTKSEHGFFISTTDRKLRERYLTLPSTRTVYTENVVYYTAYFELDVPIIPVDGNATLYITAETDNVGLVLDKFTVTKQDSYLINAVGDSITFGDSGEAFAFSGTYTSYPHLLQHILNNKIASGEITGKDNFIVSNLGIPGAAMMKNGKWAFGATDSTKPGYAMTSPIYRSSLANKADAVIVMLGTNDAVVGSDLNFVTKEGVAPETAFTNSAVALMKDYADARKSTGLAETELFFATSPKTKIATEKPLIASKIIPLQRKIAADNGWNIIDIADKTKDWGEAYYSDNVNPNFMGYKILAEYVADGFINKVKANNVALGNLFSTAPLSPAFNSGVTSYEATTVDSKITLTAVANNATDKINIKKGNTVVESDATSMVEAKDITLTDGENVYTITVTAADGKTKVYTVTVTKTDRLAYVSDLPWLTNTPGIPSLPNRRDQSSPERNTAGVLQYNTATTGERVPSKIYTKGVGMQVGEIATPAYIVVAIPKGATHFDSLVGLDYTRFTGDRSASIKGQVFFGTSATAFDATAAKESGTLTITPKTTFVDMHVAIPAGKTHMKLVGVTTTTGEQALWNGCLDWADTRFTTTGITSPIALSEVAVPTITAPANGEKPTSATVEATKNYIAVGTVWKKVSALHFGEFGPSTAYTAEITLKAKPGYKFADTITITGNTTPAYSAIVLNDKSVAVLTKNFAATEATTAKLSALTSTVPFTPAFSADTLAYTAVNTMADNFSVTATPADTAAGVVTVKNGDTIIDTNATNGAGRAITVKVPLALGNNAIKVQVTSAGKTTVYTIAVKRMPSTSFISDLPWARDVKGFVDNPNKRDKSANETDESIQLNKNPLVPVATDYAKGVGIHGAVAATAGYITVEIPNGAKKFQADVGVAYQRFSPPSAHAATAKLTFDVTFGTNADVSTGTVQGFTTAKKMVSKAPATGESNTFERVDILIPAGKTHMKLKVSGANEDAIGGGHGNWADAKFISDTTINSAVFDLTPPETGIASTNAIVDAKENYTHTSTVWKDGATPLTVPAAFGAGKTYNVTVVLTAKAGYKFLADSVVYGYNKPTVSSDGNTMTITKTYAATAAANVNLSAFSSSIGTIDPPVAANVLNYVASTASDNITVLATAADTGARIAINKNGTLIANSTTNTISQNIAITEGVNTLTAVVTNGGATKTYTLTVTKLLDSAYISDLEWLASVSGWDRVTNKKDLAANKDAVENIQLNASATAPFVSKEYAKGVGIHASTVNSKGYVVVAIPDGYTKFKADVGVAFQRFRATGNQSTVSAKAYVYFDTTQAGVVAKTTGATYTSEKSLTAKRAPAAATEINTFYPIDIAIPAGAKFMKIQAFGTDIDSGHVNFADAQFSTATATNKITTVSPAVKTPVTGDTPANATPTSGENYTVTRTTWKQGTATQTGAFAASTVYNVEIELNANSGYAFPLAVLTPGFTDVRRLDNGAKIVMKKTFNATGATALTNIANATFTITEPVKNATSSNAAVLATANYTMLSTTWYDGDTEIRNAVFERDTVYKAVVKLQAKAGFRFASNASLQGLTGYSTPSFDVNLNVMTVEKTFATTGKDNITSVGITLAAPVTGNAPATATVPDAAKYSAATKWLVGTADKPAGNFLKATVYTVEVTLTADTGYVFATTITPPAGYTVKTAIAEGATTVTYKQTFAQTKDTAALAAAITAAQSKHNAAVAGTAAGQYTAAVKATYQTAINAAKAVKDNATSTQAQLDAAVTTLATATTTFTNSVNKDTVALAAAITAAQAKHDAAVVGTDAGQYTEAAKATYQTAINAAKAVKDNANSTQEQINTAVTTLATATTTFTNAANVDTTVLKPGDINGDGKFDIEDALVALKVAAGVIEQPTGNKFINGNINKVGGSATIIDKADANALLGHILNDTTPA